MSTDPMTDASADDDVDDETTPPSVRLVERVLEEIEPATPSELVEETDAPRSTVQFALRRLREQDHVVRRRDPTDARQALYETR